MKRLILSIIPALLLACNVNTNPCTGEKIGQIVKLNKTGMISTTWEAELIRGGMSGGSGVVGIAPFDFTIEGDSLAKIAQAAMTRQTEVTVKYRIEGISRSTRSDMGIFAVSIDPAPK